MLKKKKKKKTQSNYLALKPNGYQELGMSMYLVTLILQTLWTISLYLDPTN